MRLLVTEVAGFIGSHLAECLVSEGPAQATAGVHFEEKEERVQRAGGWLEVNSGNEFGAFTKFVFETRIDGATEAA